MSFNPNILTESIELNRTKLIIIIHPQTHNFPTSLIFNQGLKFLKVTNFFLFTFKEINKHPSRIVIYERNIIHISI